MKSLLGAWSLALLLFASLGVGIGRADNMDPTPLGRSTAATILAAQVREIAGSSMVSRAKKEKRISTEVRIAVVAATAYKRNSGEILGIALELATAAARAAPQFTEVVSAAASFAPAVTRIDGATGQIRAAAFAAAKKPAPGRRKLAPAREYAETAPAARETEDEEAPAPRRPARHPTSAADTPMEPAMDDTAEGPEREVPSRSSVARNVAAGENTSFHVTADVSAQLNDNVFLSSTDKVHDTIISATPGAEFHFGQRSLAHGSLAYHESFQRYANKSAANVTLGSGNGDFGYNDGNVTAVAGASFQQLYQTNTDILAQGRRELVRSDTLGLNGSVEKQLGAKTSVMIGTSFNRISYKSAGLIGSQDTGLPVKLYFKTTPKVDLSAGVTYDWVKPQNNGPRGRDGYYNIGARGSFTPKLSGEFSVGYRIREVGDSARESLWGFDGALNYELTPKTSSALVLSRQFSTSALGESVQNGSYVLRLSTDVSPEWQIGASLTFRDSDYGTAVFTGATTPVTNPRQDKTWEGGLMTSYIFSSWCSASANYSFRKNHSTVTGVDFSNNLLNLMLGFRY